MPVVLYQARVEFWDRYGSIHSFTVGIFDSYRMARNAIEDIKDAGELQLIGDGEIKDFILNNKTMSMEYEDTPNHFLP